MRPKAVATFSATPSWGQSWRAISKVRAWRVSRLGEDLERLEAILENLFWRRGPLAHRQRVPLGAAQKSPARAACTRRAGAHAEDGEGRRICLARNSAQPKGKFVERSRCRPNGLGLRPRTTEGNALAMGSLAARCRRTKKGSPKWLARRTATSPQDPDPLPLPDPDGPPCFAPYSRAYESRKRRFRRKLRSHRRRRLTGLLPGALMP